MKFLIFCLVVGAVVARRSILPDKSMIDLENSAVSSNSDESESFYECLEKNKVDFEEINVEDKNLTEKIADHCRKAGIQRKIITFCAKKTGFEMPEDSVQAYKESSAILEAFCRDPAVTAEQFTCLGQLEDPLFKLNNPMLTSAKTCLEWENTTRLAADQLSTCKVSPADQRTYLSSFEKPDCSKEYEKFAACIKAKKSDLEDLEDIIGHKDLDQLIAETQNACKKYDGIDEVIDECNRQMGGELEKIKWSRDYIHVFCRDPTATARQFHCVYQDKTNKFPSPRDDCEQWLQKLTTTMENWTKCEIPRDAQYVYIYPYLKTECFDNVPQI